MFDFVAPADFHRFLWRFNRQGFQIFNEGFGLEILDPRRQFRLDLVGNGRCDLFQLFLVLANHGKLRNSGLQALYDFAGFIVFRVGERDFARNDEAVSFKPYVNAGLAVQNRFFNGAAKTELFRLLP